MSCAHWLAGIGSRVGVTEASISCDMAAPLWFERAMRAPGAVKTPIPVGFPFHSQPLSCAGEFRPARRRQLRCHEGCAQSPSRARRQGFSMEMHQIRYFIAVAKTLNFTQAAKDCNVAQPSLSRAIKTLEDELGGALFRRERALTHL